MKKALSVLVLLLVVFSAVAMADATITLTGGSLTQTNALIQFPGQSLAGAKIMDVASVAGTPWTVTDARGTGEGWNFQVSAGDFVEASNPAHKIPVYDVTTVGSEYKLEAMVPAESITALQAQLAADKPVTQAAVMTAVGNGAVQLISAETDKGMGAWSFAPEFQMDIPANTFAGLYTAPFTVTINSGL